MCVLTKDPRPSSHLAGEPTFMSRLTACTVPNHHVQVGIQTTSLWPLTSKITNYQNGGMLLSGEDEHEDPQFTKSQLRVFSPKSRTENAKTAHRDLCGGTYTISLRTDHSLHKCRANPHSTRNTGHPRRRHRACPFRTRHTSCIRRRDTSQPLRIIAHLKDHPS